LNLPLDKGIILFGAVSADSDRNKGMDLLLEALNFIIQNDKDFALRNIIVVFGTNNKSLDLIFPLPVVCLGVIKDEQLLPQIYSSADLTVVPSRRESFGQVASESSSCGTPVVAFETTGLIDIVVHLKTGYLAEPFSTVDLAEGIKMIVEDVGLRNFMSNMARERAITTFDIDITTQMHINLYSQIIDENHL
jgi:glycosyltransferase involved in cell wall biosynthesis